MANEKRLIDANRLTLEFIAQFCGNGTELSPDAQFEIQVMINHAPTIEAVEVVRCKDCKWNKPDKLLCKHWCTRFIGCMEMQENDFCSYGKNREVE